MVERRTARARFCGSTNGPWKGHETQTPVDKQHGFVCAARVSADAEKTSILRQKRFGVADPRLMADGWQPHFGPLRINRPAQAILDRQKAGVVRQRGEAGVVTKRHRGDAGRLYRPPPR